MAVLDDNLLNFLEANRHLEITILSDLLVEQCQQFFLLWIIRPVFLEELLVQTQAPLLIDIFDPGN